MFRINEVVDLDCKLYRILALLGDEVVWISIEDDCSFPSIILLEEMVAAIEQGALNRVTDPYIELAFQTPEKDSVAQIKRNRNYELIKPLINNPQFYIPEVRSACINEIIASQGSTKQTLYRMSRRYWQRGQIPNALIPDYKNSGGKGKKRKVSENKLGRPRKYMPGVGAIIDKNTERLFRIAIDKYLLIDKGRSFPNAHRRFKTLYEAYYPDVEESEMPTNWQMLHFYRREYSKVEKIKKCVNKIEYNKDIQPLKSTANTQALGPGSRYEIDATIADIYLVSNSERENIVGRPVVYMVIDVFSRMVTGLYIGFENPSYVAAMQALVLAMTDKVAYCKKYGFEIDEDQWPAVGLPDAILADRGELLGTQIESLESSFSVRIENTPPYRGDAKGIVERSFRTIQATFKPFAPGIVTGTKVKKRGGNDYRLDAKLTVHEFIEIILSSILIYNQSETLKKYDRDIDMPADLEMTPLSIWNWGVQNRTGRLRAVSEDALKVNLLPRVDATFSDLGVCVFGLYFTSKEVLQKGWMHRSKEASRPVVLEAGYDPANAEYIYLFPRKNSAEYWVCKLTERSREFVGCSFWDVWQVQNSKKKAIAKSSLISDQKKREYENLIEDKIRAAISKAPSTDHISKVKRISSIRENRNKDRTAERQDAAYTPHKKNNDQPAVVIPLTDQEPVDDYSFPSHIDELFADGEDD